MSRTGPRAGSLMALLLFTSMACSRDPSPAASSTPTTGAASPGPRAAEAGARAAAVAAATGARARADGCPTAPEPLGMPAPRRMVAIGDVHGDLGSARAALRLAGAIDADDRWVGGDLVLAQLGDILDRGDDEQAIVDLFERLEREAAAAGGAVVWLLGNHELMNAAGDFRYVTPGGWADFADAPGVTPDRADLPPDVAAALARLQPGMRARVSAMLPGGVYARVFAGQDVVARIGDTLLAHAGVTAPWTQGLPSLNRDARCWLASGGEPPAGVQDPEGPVWTRAWGGEQVDCAALSEVLAATGAARMVVGHTPQPTGITSACDGRLWRVDTGLADYYGGPTEVLEITADGARPLRATAP